MDMKLRKMGRSELVDRLSKIAEAYPAEAEVVVLNRFGEQRSVVKCYDREDGAYLATYRKGAPELALAPVMGSDVKEMGLADVVSALGKCSSDDVWLQWPADGEKPETTVGNAVGVRTKDKAMVILAPVPRDIERINAEVHEMVSKWCPEAKNGTECGECPRLGSCAHLAIANDMMVAKYEKGER